MKLKSIELKNPLGQELSCLPETKTVQVSLYFTVLNVGEKEIKNKHNVYKNVIL